MVNSQPKNQNVQLRTEIPGPKSTELRKEEEKLLADGLQGFAIMSGIVVKKAFGNIIEDVDDNKLLDIIGGIGVNGLGHSHPVWVKAIQKQAELASVGSFTSEARIDLLKIIDRHKIGKLNRVQMYSSGAAAVESALRLVKNKTGKSELVSFSGAFHGKTHGVLALMGSDFKDSYSPFSKGAHSVPYANCYRCPLNTTYPKCGLACVEEARKKLKKEVKTGVAAFIIEPIQGTAGNIIPPADFLPAIKELANEFDALFIADEMITGVGRTGTWWGCQHSGVTPDIMTVGKQFGGGYPVSAIITTTEISKTKPWGNPSGSSSSYGGNPLASAAVKTSLQIIEQEKLVQNSKEVGNYFLEQILPFKERYPFIGDIRGIGLMLAIEFVEDKQSKIPLSRNKMIELFNLFLKSGLLTMAYTSNFRIQPAMTIDRQTIDNIVVILKENLDKFRL